MKNCALWAFLVLINHAAYSQMVTPEELPASFLKSLEYMMPGIPPSGVYESEIPGLMKVVYGPRLMYLSQDGQYLFDGNIFNINDKTNVTRETQSVLRKDMLSSSFTKDDMVIYSPEKTARYTITVFSDVECEYCRKMHQEIEQYLAAGIRVRYILFPRTGMGTPSANTAAAVLCSTDRKKALTAAKRGEMVDTDAVCAKKMREDQKSPINRAYILGQMMGMQGTPTILLDDGTMLPGYVSAQQLATAFNQF